MRVLVATDGSDPARIGCDAARDLAMRTGGLVRFVAVLPPTEDLFGGPWPVAASFDPDAIERDAVARLDAVLRDEVDRMPTDIQPTCVLRRGRPADQIVAAAEEWDADLIVLGSRGHNALESILLGSTSEEVVDRSSVPVLVARLPRVRRMVVGVDGSEVSGEAVEFLATSLAGPDLEAIVVDVTPSTYPWWLGLGAAAASSYDPFLKANATFSHDAQLAADEAARKLAIRRFGSTREHRDGQAAEELIHAADELGADTIVVGSRGQTGVVRMIVGSVARHVLRHAPQSVLVVHPATSAEAVSTGLTQPIATATSPTVQPTDDRPDSKETATMRILLAYDGSEPAKRALTMAATMTKALGASLDVVSVVPFQAGRAPIAPWDDGEVHDLELLDAKTRLHDLGVSCRLYEPVGDPAHEIERIAAEGRYAMVVVGSRRQGVVGRILQGSVSEHLATHSDATVVIAR